MIFIPHLLREISTEAEFLILFRPAFRGWMSLGIMGSGDVFQTGDGKHSLYVLWPLASTERPQLPRTSPAALATPFSS